MLEHLAVAVGEDRAERLMTARDIGERGAPRVHVEGPRSRITTGKLYAAEVHSICWMTHSRCWACESGSSAGRSPAASTGRAAAPERPARSTSSATVGASNRSRIASSVSSAVRALLTSRVASSEWPPSSKKSLSMPTLPSGMPSTSAKSAHSVSSCEVRGARLVPVPAPPESVKRAGAGRALTSSLPLTVSGSVSTGTSAAGTM